MPCTFNSRRTVRRAAFWLMLLMVAAACTPALRAAEESPDWLLRPITAQVTLHHDAARHGQDSQRLARYLLNRAGRLLGARWQLEIHVAPLPTDWSTTGVAPGGQEMSADESKISDKVVWLELAERSRGKLVWRSREWDTTLRHWGTLSKREVAHRRATPEAGVRQLLDVLSPLARVSHVQPGGATLRVQGSALPQGDAQAVPSPESGLWRPFQAQRSAQTGADGMLPIEWTYLVTRDWPAAELSTRLVTGIRSPLRSWRVGNGLFALPVVSRFPATELRLHGLAEGEPPLAGYELLEKTEDAQGWSPVGWTDRAGRIRIDATDAGLRTFYIRHGEQVLARIPLLCGEQAELAVSLPNREERLKAEGLVLRLQSEIVDAVARREILLASIELALERNQLDAAQQYLERLRQLPTERDFLIRLQRERERFGGNDGLLGDEIRQLFQRTRQTVAQHLPDDPVRDAELRVLQASRRPRLNSPG